MSKIDDLIKEKCPDGVDYLQLKDVTTPLKKGTLKTSELIADGDYPVMNSGRSYYGRYNDYNNEDAITIAARGEYAGYINYNEGKFWAGGLCYPYKSLNEELYLTKFIFYALKNQQEYIRDTLVAKGSIPALNKQDIDKFRIPIPPIEVQREIVGMLDSLTELEAELEAELTKRKQQYEEYLELLLYSERYPIKRIGDIGTLERGRRFVHKDDRDEGIPAIHYGELYTHYGVWANSVKTHIDSTITTRLRYANKGDVVIVGAGENKDDIGVAVAWLGDYDVAIHDACYTLKHNQNPKYISYCLRSRRYHQQIKKYVSEGKICSISLDGVSRAEIPIPPLDKQEQIVSVLDKFDKLCNDLSDGLPAEIEARHKQYEYYRDKLLTFEEKVVQ